jgi:hypothetical protein
VRNPRRPKNHTRPERLVVRVREALATNQPYRVVVPIELKNSDPTDVRDLVLDALRRTTELESRVSVRSDGLEVELQVQADSTGSAKAKALYWLRRSIDKHPTMSWTGRGLGRATAERV